MTDSSLFRDLPDRIGVAGAPDDASERRAVWERSYYNALKGAGESLSGTGSSLVQTQVVRARLGGLLRRIGAAAILDAPCGDHHWMSHVGLGASYVRVDIVPELIERNRRQYPGRKFLLADIVSDDLPRADLILCRDALVHCSFGMALEMLRNFRRSGARWLLTTTFPGRDINHDTEMGRWRTLNLELPPFGFPPPDELIVERCSERNGLYRDKSLGLWRVTDLALEGGIDLRPDGSPRYPVTRSTGDDQ